MNQGKSMSTKKTDEQNKVITIKVKDLQQLKIILATWYSYLLSKNKDPNFDLQEAIKTPIIYNIEKDELELLLTGSQEMLSELNQYIDSLNKKLKDKK